ncbi:hypothetical protein H8D30_04665 [bacterium]|nr:hypothetical protein [bacterium]
MTLFFRSERGRYSVLLVVLAVLGTQVLSVKSRSEIGMWRELRTKWAGRLESHLEEGDFVSAEGDLSFLLYTDSWLFFRYGDGDAPLRIADLRREYGETPNWALPYWGFSGDGRMEAEVSLMTRPQDKLIGGTYLTWILNIQNSTDKPIPPNDFDVLLHFRDGSTMKPLEGTDLLIVNNLARYQWNYGIRPGQDRRILLLFPKLDWGAIEGFEVKLDGSTSWIPFWENLVPHPTPAR